MSKKDGKIHEIVGHQIITNKSFRDGVQEYWLSLGISVSLPDESMINMAKSVKVEKAVKPWEEGTFRYLEDEEIKVGDQWAPLKEPERWRNVADSVGKMTSQFKLSRFRRLTIEIEQEVILPIGKDTGSNLVDIECWVWNEGDNRPRGKAMIDGYDEIRNVYTVGGSHFGHAQPVSMGEPILRPQHPHKDAGMALIRCMCVLWNDDSVNIDPLLVGTKDMVASYTDNLYISKSGRSFRHAQPIGDSIVTLPPVILPPAAGEVLGQTGEAVLGRRCYVWNDSTGARPNGAENATMVDVTGFDVGEKFCYKTGFNCHQFARPIEFGHPHMSAEVQLYKHAKYRDGKIGFIVEVESGIATMANGDVVSEFEIINFPTKSDLVGKRAWCWDTGRGAAKSYIVEKYDAATLRYSVRSGDKITAQLITFPFAAFDVLNQSPRQNSGDELIGVECYVWDERFSSERFAVVSDYNAEGYLASATTRTKRYINARPILLGVPQ